MEWLTPGWIILFAIVGLILFLIISVFGIATYQIVGFIKTFKKQALFKIQNDVDEFESGVLTLLREEIYYDLSSNSVKSICKLNSQPTMPSSNVRKNEELLADIVNTYITDNINSRSYDLTGRVEIYKSKIRVFVNYVKRANE